MVKKKHKEKQGDIFGWEFMMGDIRKLRGSIYETFRQQVYEKVNNAAFEVLSPSKDGRPHTPFDMLVTIMGIKEWHGWTFDELEVQMYFNFGVRYACGMTPGDAPITKRTVYKFLQELREHEDETGVDLCKEEIIRLMVDHKETFKVNGKIARADSTQLATNVTAYNRMELVIQTIKLLYKVVSEEDKEYIMGLCEAYIKYDSDNIVGGLTGEAVKIELPRAGAMMLDIQEHFGNKYEKLYEWNLFVRVFNEQFKIEMQDDKVNVVKKPFEEKTSSDVRSIHDPEATLRYKNGENHTGYVLNATEIVDWDLGLNLIVDVEVCQNNVYDGHIMCDRLDVVKEIAPELDELHVDAAYSGADLDAKLDAYGIKVAQTCICGVKSSVTMLIEKDKNNYYATCASGQRVACVLRKKGYAVDFDPSICKSCPHLDKCPVRLNKTSGNYVYYLNETMLYRKVRHSYIYFIPESRRALRSGVESTMWQYKCKTNAGKTRLRGLIRHKLWALFRTLGINISRIHKYTTGLSKKGGEVSLFYSNSIFVTIIDLFWSIGNTILHFFHKNSSNFQVRPLLG